MIRPVDKLNIALPGPSKQAPKRPSLRPFVAVDPMAIYNPWALCTPDHRSAILVTCGLMPAFINKLTSRLTPDQRHWVLERRRTHKYPDGREFQIQAREMDDIPVGGKLWLKNSRGCAITIHDVKSFFQMNFQKLNRLYRTDDLAAIMERTRASLLEVGITAQQQDWYRSFSLADYVWRKLDMNVWSAPCMGTQEKGPGNLQGYHVFGHTDEPVYAYDINSAYLSVMAKFPSFRPFADYMWRARQELAQENDPAAKVLKLAATIMPGKFTSTLPGNRYYRPALGDYIRQHTNRRLERAMAAADIVEEGPNLSNVYRWCVDGFLARTNIEHLLDTGTGLGQWKPVKTHQYLSIAKTNVWYTNCEWKEGGYTVTEEEILNGTAHNPFEIPTTRTIFDWTHLEERVEPATLYQEHNWTACRKCFDYEAELHDRL